MKPYEFVVDDLLIECFHLKKTHKSKDGTMLLSDVEKFLSNQLVEKGTVQAKIKAEVSV